MKLYEFEGHKILARAGIDSPFFVVVSDLDEVKQARKRLKFPIVVKVQVLSGKRAKSGGIKIVKNEKQLFSFCKESFGKSFNGEEVRFIILAEKVEIVKEYYVAITYDTVRRTPFIMFNSDGGIDVEEIQKRNPRSILRIDIDPISGPRKKDLEKIFQSFSYSSSDPERSRRRIEKFPLNSSRIRSNNIDNFIDFCQRLWDAFTRFDCRLVEINPLAVVDNKLIAIDAKVILDDNGLARHKDLDVTSKGAISAIPTERELEAKKIDSDDYRGSAGSTFIELGGDIAILASGGGASLLVMDSLIAAGGKPANYTEYSGNPPLEKVEKLTKITLSRENLCGCLVAGAVANFTDIYETLSGFIRGLKAVRPKPSYPIVIRRGGPRQEEAYKYLSEFSKKEGFDIHLFGPATPISVACKTMVELSNAYKELQVTSAKF
ncbi:hypothetical protein A3I53_03740 [Candidatus Curtissbacteria bacterium RIFCSPLOWO2_02_FULL_40_13b]|uniref:ATP-grasp domain-containing protein n=1 Tax=Candidatus Curtissbacteria bacterium RIFCSPLOWO2_02_FULL_40_13b TaxID=1797733 RepID=A0A1F5HV97_9BACT|nr:MAG: hypothetical protein A3I53_03740 [Candidatus Curtissbacteria bacterium RIFCSPLOWO2_02_FULL_40_13b]